jgi:hypothetical protein
MQTIRTGTSETWDDPSPSPPKHQGPTAFISKLHCTTARPPPLGSPAVPKNAPCSPAGAGPAFSNPVRHHGKPVLSTKGCNQALASCPRQRAKQAVRPVSRVPHPERSNAAASHCSALSVTPIWFPVEPRRGHLFEHAPGPTEPCRGVPSWQRFQEDPIGRSRTKPEALTPALGKQGLRLDVSTLVLRSAFC